MHPASPGLFQRSSDVIYSELADGHGVLLSIEAGRYYSLNPAAVVVWTVLENAASLEQISDAVAQMFEVDRHRARDDVDDLLTDLVDRGLVEPVRS